MTVTATSALATGPGSATVNIKTATAMGSYSTIQVLAAAAGGAGHADVVTLNVDEDWASFFVAFFAPSGLWGHGATHGLPWVILAPLRGY